MRAIIIGAVSMFVVSLSWDARADLPRPEGWEPTCTIEKEQAKGGGPCEHCRGWQNPDPCQKALEDKGYTRRCTEGGAGSYVAVWCKSAAGPTSTTTTPTTNSTAANTAPATTTATTATTNTTSPPPVAPASDNRRGSGLCSVESVGHDTPDAAMWMLGLLAASFGFRQLRSASGNVKRNH
ncbi:MAG TPA: hypothetical protein PK156_26195 [Polyangium sp.]|nr:hypothetical protein [Polyangium sp.]